MVTNIYFYDLLFYFKFYSQINLSSKLFFFNYIQINAAINLISDTSDNDYLVDNLNQFSQSISNRPTIQSNVQDIKNLTITGIKSSLAEQTRSNPQNNHQLKNKMPQLEEQCESENSIIIQVDGPFSMPNRYPLSIFSNSLPICQEISDQVQQIQPMQYLRNIRNQRIPHNNSFDLNQQSIIQINQFQQSAIQTQNEASLPTTVPVNIFENINTLQRLSTVASQRLRDRTNRVSNDRVGVRRQSINQNFLRMTMINYQRSLRSSNYEVNQNNNINNNTDQIRDYFNDNNNINQNTVERNIVRRHRNWRTRPFGYISSNFSRVLSRYIRRNENSNRFL